MAAFTHVIFVRVGDCPRGKARYVESQQYCDMYAGIIPPYISFPIDFPDDLL